MTKLSVHKNDFFLFLRIVHDVFLKVFFFANILINILPQKTKMFFKNLMEWHWIPHIAP